MTDATEKFLKSLELSFRLKENYEKLKTECSMLGITLPETAMSLLAEKIVKDSVENNWLPITVIIPPRKAKQKKDPEEEGVLYMSLFSTMEQEYPFKISFSDLDKVSTSPEKYMSDRIVYQVFSRNECEMLISSNQKKHIEKILSDIVVVLRQEKATKTARDFKNSITNIIKSTWK